MDYQGEINKNKYEALINIVVKFCEDTSNATCEEGEGDRIRFITICNPYIHGWASKDLETPFRGNRDIEVDAILEKHLNRSF